MEKPGIEATGRQTGKSGPERTFTKDEVNALMQKRVTKSHQAFFNRYGVKDLAELDALVGKAGSYDSMKANIEELTTNNSDLTKKLAYQIHNINPEKYNDIETYFKGKGLDINENSLSEELKSHTDWKNKVTGIVPIGSENGTQVTPDDEKAMAEKIFGVTF